MGTWSERKAAKTIRRAERLEQSKVDCIEKHQARWIDIIAALTASGHAPEVEAEWRSGDQGGGKWVATLRCDRCDTSYSLAVLRRWWGLSPRRSCDVQAQIRAKKAETHRIMVSGIETRWRSRRSEMIEALELADHVPVLSVDASARPSSIPLWLWPVLTTLTCPSCSTTYRGSVLHRWWVMSPTRNCPVYGNSSTATETP